MNPAVSGVKHNTEVSFNEVNRAGAARASFNNVFQDTLSKQVRFSKHADTRLNDRNISLTEGQMERVESGIERAGEKGIRDTLVLVDDVALVVNIRSRTVITALQHGTENIFSNIDGAVIV
jgi:flagellar operon protein